MLLTIPDVLNPAELASARATLARAPWSDGRATTGQQSSLVKRNLQLPEDGPEANALRQVVVQALQRSAVFASAVLPKRVLPPVFNRYDVGMGFGAHIDNAIRGMAGASGPVRTDVSATLFLSDPADYDGGDLVIEGSFGAQRVRLPAGNLVVYPASSVHRVEAVTRGSRVGCVFWVQSLIRDDGRRALLYDMDCALGGLRRRGMTGEPEVVALSGTYHNLLRQWSEV